MTFQGFQSFFIVTRWVEARRHKEGEKQSGGNPPKTFLSYDLTISGVTEGFRILM